MVSPTLQSPPAALEDLKSGLPKKGNSPTAKSIKANGRVAKRANPNLAATHRHGHVTHTAGMDGRHKRVWKACERCRMKKTKCDGEFPCKRCKDDGVVCTAGARKKVEYKQLPKGYAEVLENTQFALIATVHKLYAMVRNAQSWELGEPELNDRGQPVIHNIAQKLGCIRPNSDIDLPVHSVFPEDEAGMAELARQLEEQQPEGDGLMESKDGDAAICNTTDRFSPDLDQSDCENDFGKRSNGFRKPGLGSSTASTLSPQSFTGSNDFDFHPANSDLDPTGLLTAQSPAGGNFPSWSLSKSQSNELAMHFLQQASLQNMEIMPQVLLEPEFGTIKPDILSCPGSDVMMGIADPMIYSGFEGEPMRI